MRPTALLPLLLLAGGCATAAPAPDVANTRESHRAPGVRQTSLGTEVLAPKQDPVSPRLIGGEPTGAYEALPAAYAELRLPLAGRDDASRLVESERVVLRGTLAGQPVSRFLDCGVTAGGPAANVYRVELRVRTTVAATTAGAQLVTEVQGTASNPTTSSPPIRCASTGLLEDRLAERVRALQAGGAAPR